MAAVEFCRDRILSIPIDQYDAWFRSKHPQAFVPRQTKEDEKNKLDLKRSKSSIEYRTKSSISNRTKI